MFKRRFALIVIFSMTFFLFSLILSARAQIQIDFRSEVNKTQVAPMEEFYAMHTISNMTNTDIVVRVTEWLEGTPDSFTSEITVKPGQELRRKGITFNAVNGIGLNVLKYRAEYRSIDTYEVWIELVTDFLVVETVVDTSISVRYNAKQGEPVFKGQSVEFVVEVTSLGNVPIQNILVEDSTLGIIGEIPLLEVGEVEILSKSFLLHESTQGYIVLRYMEPVTHLEVIKPFHDARVNVEVSEQAPVVSWELSARPDKIYIPHSDEVTFSLRIKNTGEAAIRNIEVLNWDGEIFHMINRLMPGNETLFQYSSIVEPEKPYEFKARGQVQGIRNLVETAYTAIISELKPLAEIERQVVEEQQTVLRYTIKNIGNVALVDIVIEELEIGVIARLERMEPGDSEQFTVNLDLSRDRISKPILFAKEATNMTIYQYHAEEILIPALGAAKTPLIKVNLQVEPRTLSLPGTVNMEFTVRNEGNVALKNVVIILKERDMMIGNLNEFMPGEQHVFELSDLEVELSQSFTAVVRVEDDHGNELAFESASVDVTVEQVSPSLGLAQVAEEARGSFLRTVFGIILIFIILTAGALVYFLMNLFMPIIRKRRQTG